MADESWIWIKKGDCRDEVASLCELFAAETARSPERAGIEGRLATAPTGARYTVLLADGAWWQEQMKVHPNGWTGLPFQDFIARFNL